MSTVIDVDYDEYPDPIPLEKGTEVEIELRSGQIISGSNGYFIKLFAIPLGHEDASQVQIFLNPITEDMADKERKSAGRTLRRFGEGFGVPAKELNAILSEAIELEENDEDGSEAFAPLWGRTARVLTGVRPGKDDFPDTSTARRYLENKLAPKEKKGS